MNKSAGLTVAARLYLLLGAMLLGLVLMGGYAAFSLRSHILDEKKLMLQALIDSSVGVIQEQYDLYKAGKISEADAQRLAKDNLRKSRYNNGSDYFFIYNLEGVNLMHASKPEREGKNFLDSKDPNGKEYIKEWIDLLKRDGAAHIDYMFPKAGSTVAIPKVSYAKVF
jgi:methyl-accepting chemotaxis protein